MLIALLVPLALATLLFTFVLVRSAIAKRVRPSGEGMVLGAITNFFDTLGIGSYAQTTTAYKFWKLVPDQLIPGTLNVGHVMATIVQAVLVITGVAVDFTTLLAMIAAACAGAWLGAGIVAGFSRRKVQLGMGTALLGAAIIVLAQLFNLVPSGEALALSGVKLAIGVSVNCVLGALMTLGVGLYAPCMVLISVLGMNPAAAFPIMMGSCAFLMPVASMQFIRKDAYHLRAALGLALGGPLAVLLAYWLVTSLPTMMVRVLVLIVILYTSITMLRSAAVERKAAGLGAQTPQTA